MKLNLSADELLTTTRAVRRRLDTSRPVSRALLEECLEVAMQAPNGSNLNKWRWVIVDDPGKIRRLADEYAEAMKMAHGGDGSVPAQAFIDAGKGIPGYDKVLQTGFELVEKLRSVPAILVPLIGGRPETQAFATQAAMWASVIPAVWSFMLALRERGMGSCWTTVALLREKQIAEILGIPHEKYAQVGMFPIAYTEGTEFKKAWRKPVGEVLSYNGF